MKNIPKVSIIILNYNGKKCIKKTLAGVLSVNYPNLEIILVDNNSSDGSFELAKKNFPKITFIKNKANLGFSAGNNRGIRYSLERGAKYILLLNYDVEVKSDFLGYLVEVMEKDRKIGIASPVIYKNDSEKIWFSGGKIDWLKMKTQHLTSTLTDDFYNSDYITGCAMLIRTDVFNKVGLLNEDYFLYWEDADFSYKTKKAGYKLAVLEKSRIFHFEKSQEKKEKKIYWLVISGLIFFKKNSPLWLKPYYFCFILVRKIKNFIDLRKKRNLILKSVQEAYHDFKYVK